MSWLQKISYVKENKTPFLAIFIFVLNSIARHFADVWLYWYETGSIICLLLGIYASKGFTKFVGLILFPFGVLNYISCFKSGVFPEEFWTPYAQYLATYWVLAFIFFTYYANKILRLFLIPLTVCVAIIAYVEFRDPYTKSPIMLVFVIAAITWRLCTILWTKLKPKLLPLVTKPPIKLLKWIRLKVYGR